MNYNGAAESASLEYVFTALTTDANGVITKYLTSDGLVKGLGNTFLYALVRRVMCQKQNLVSATFTNLGSAWQGDWYYNTVTGLLSVQMIQGNSGGILIGGSYTGTQKASAGINCSLTIIGN